MADKRFAGAPLTPQDIAALVRGIGRVAGGIKKVQAANTQGMQPSNTGGGGGGGGAVAAPVSTLAGLPQTPLLQQLIKQGLIKEGMPPEQALAILQFAQMGQQGNIDIKALMDQIKADYERYTGDITDAGTNWMQQLYGSAYDPNDPNAAMFAQDPIFSQYAGNLAGLDETADLNLATDLAWFTKAQQAQDEYINSMMLGLSQGTIPLPGAVAAGTGGGGGGGGGGYGGGGYGGRGGGSSGGGDNGLDFGDPKTQLDFTEQYRDTDTQTFKEYHPGFAMGVAEDWARGLGLNEEDTAIAAEWANHLVNTESRPDALLKLAEQEFYNMSGQSGRYAGVMANNEGWRPSQYGLVNDLLEQYMGQGFQLGDDPNTTSREYFYQAPTIDPNTGKPIPTNLTLDPELQAQQDMDVKFLEDIIRRSTGNAGLDLSSINNAAMMQAWWANQRNQQGQQNVSNIVDMIKNLPDTTGTGQTQGSPPAPVNPAPGTGSNAPVLTYPNFPDMNNPMAQVDLRGNPIPPVTDDNPVPADQDLIPPYSQFATDAVGPVSQAIEDSDKQQALIRAARNRLPFEGMVPDQINTMLGTSLYDQLQMQHQGPFITYPPGAVVPGSNQSAQNIPPAVINGQPNPAYQEYLTQQSIAQGNTVPSTANTEYEGTGGGTYTSDNYPPGTHVEDVLENIFGVPLDPNQTAPTTTNTGGTSQIHFDVDTGSGGNSFRPLNNILRGLNRAAKPQPPSPVDDIMEVIRKIQSVGNAVSSAATTEPATISPSGGGFIDAKGGPGTTYTVDTRDPDEIALRNISNMEDIREWASDPTNAALIQGNADAMASAYIDRNLFIPNEIGAPILKPEAEAPAQNRSQWQAHQDFQYDNKADFDAAVAQVEPGSYYQFPEEGMDDETFHRNQVLQDAFQSFQDFIRPYSENWNNALVSNQSVEQLQGTQRLTTGADSYSIPAAELTGMGDPSTIAPEDADVIYDLVPEGDDYYTSSGSDMGFKPQNNLFSGQNLQKLLMNAAQNKIAPPEKPVPTAPVTKPVYSSSRPSNYGGGKKVLAQPSNPVATIGKILKGLQGVKKVAKSFK